MKYIVDLGHGAKIELKVFFIKKRKPKSDKK